MSTKKQSPPPKTQINTWATSIPENLSPLPTPPKPTDQSIDEEYLSEPKQTDTAPAEEIFQIDLEPLQLHKNKPSI